MSIPIHVKVLPIEYQKTAKYPRIVVYRNIKLSKHLTQGIFDRLIEETRMKEKARAVFNPDNYVIYQYGMKPMLILDLEANEVLTYETVIQHYGLRKVQQQATILLRLLKKYGYAKFKRVVVSSYRMGNNLKENLEVFEAYQRLFFRTAHVEIKPYYKYPNYIGR